MSVSVVLGAEEKGLYAYVLWNIVAEGDNTYPSIRWRVGGMSRHTKILCVVSSMCRLGAERVVDLYQEIVPAL